MARIDFTKLEAESLVKLPEGGVIAKGSPQKLHNGRMIQGDDLDHFRIVPADVLRGVDFEGRAAAEGEDMACMLTARALEVYGPEPRSLNILFLGATIQDVFRYGNSAWANPKSGGKGFLLRECDGNVIKQERQEVGSGFQLFRNPTDEQGCPKRCACLDAQGNEIHQQCPLGCTAKAQLTVILPDLAIPRQFTFRTGGINDIREIMRNLRPYDGVLNATPFRLVRTQRDVSHVKPDGSTVRVPKWVCHVELAASSGMHFLQAQNTRNFQQITGEVIEAEPITVEAWHEQTSAAEAAFMLEPTPAPAAAPKPTAKPAGKPKAAAKPKAPSKPIVTPAPSVTPDKAQERSAELIAARTAAGLTTEQVKELFAGSIDVSGNPVTNPVSLCESDYQALLDRIMEAGNGGLPPGEEWDGEF